jgi:murein DD-endopeptidase MepM/ murein hydrolase activator NlpD
MQNDKIAPDPGTPDAKELPSDLSEASPSQEELKGVARIWEGLVRLGLGEATLRVGTSVLTISLFLIVIWIMGNFYLKAKANGPAASGSGAQSAQAAVLSTSTPAAVAALPSFAIPTSISFDAGITRLAQLHTTLPTRPRFEVITYTVVAGDTVYGIAEKFGLHPETILWGNIYALAQGPDKIQPGLVLNILPVDGAYHKWSSGEGLNGVAKFYGVTPQDIIDWPGNHLSAATIGNYSAPTIEPGTMLIIPGGHGEFSDWSAPLIPRSNPAVAYVLGPGSCGTISTGAIGNGTFVWPTTLHSLSGYHFDPAINHYGVDFAGHLGSPIYATDGGVVVYAGLNNFGYGNMIVIDHGTGWQSLYGHLSQINVSCGQSVAQGDEIGLMGSTGNSTGPHLHFELRSQHFGRVDPMNMFH